jgi:signal transduction histidine kinase
MRGCLLFASGSQGESLSADQVTIRDRLTSPIAVSPRVFAMLLPIFMLGIWSRGVGVSEQITSWQATSIAILAPLVGLGVFTLGSWGLRRYSTAAPWHSVVLWTMSGAFISLTALSLRTVATGTWQIKFAGIGLYTVFALILGGTTIYGLTTLASKRNLVNQLLETQQVLRAIRADAAAFARDQSQQLADAIAIVIIPEIGRLRDELAGMNDAPAITRLEEMRTSVGAYSAEVVRPLSHELSPQGITTGESVLSMGNQNRTDDSDDRVQGRGSEILGIIVSARISIPLAVIASFLLFIAQFNLGCTGVPAVASLSFFGVMLLGGLMTRISFLRKTPWSAIWLFAVSILAFTIYRWAISTGGPSCRWATSDWELVAANIVAVVLLLVLSIVFEGARQNAETSVALKVVNLELEEEAHELQRNASISHDQIAHLLHGPVQGRLAAISMALNLHLAQVRQGERPSIAELREQINSLLDEVESDVRNLISRADTAPLAFHEFLESLVVRWRGLATLYITSNTQADSFLARNPTLAQHVIRSVEEAVTNASRHGNARRVDISYFCAPVDPSTPSGDVQFVMTVTDDGLGPSSTVKPGLGLDSISAAGGLWELTAGPVGGAQLSIHWPRYPK